MEYWDLMYDFCFVAEKQKKEEHPNSGLNQLYSFDAPNRYSWRDNHEAP